MKKIRNISDKKVRNILLVLVILSGYGFSCIYWQGKVLQYVNYLVGIIIFLTCFRQKNKVETHPINGLVLCLMIYPILSFVLSSYLFNPTAWGYYKYRIFAQLYFCIFFIFSIYRISERAIVKSFVFIGIIVLFIQIIQQFFPDSAIFGIRDVNSPMSDGFDKVEIRNGLHRYRLMSVYFITMLCVFYYWQRLLVKRTRKDIFMFLAFLVSIYLFLTRQIMFSVGMTLLLSFVFTNNKRMKWWAVIISVVISIILYFSFDLIFGELMGKTSEEMDESNIRLVCFDFYWEKIMSSPVTALFGNGFSSHLLSWQEDLRLTPADIGMIGEAYYYGFIWMVIYFYTLYLVLVKYRAKIPLYIKQFYFSTFLISVMVFPYRSAIENFIWGAILYISCQYIKSNYTYKPLK